MNAFLTVTFPQTPARNRKRDGIPSRLHDGISPTIPTTSRTTPSGPFTYVCCLSTGTPERRLSRRLNDVAYERPGAHAASSLRASSLSHRPVAIALPADELPAAIWGDGRHASNIWHLAHAGGSDGHCRGFWPILPSTPRLHEPNVARSPRISAHGWSVCKGGPKSSLPAADDGPNAPNGITSAPVAKRSIAVTSHEPRRKPTAAGPQSCGSTVGSTLNATAASCSCAAKPTVAGVSQWRG